MLTQIQRDTLLKPIRPARVKQTQGNANLEAWDVTAYLTKIFGFEGWDKEIIKLEMLFEMQDQAERTRNNAKVMVPIWTVAYACDMRLILRDPNGEQVKFTEDTAVGDSINQPSRADAHDLARKAAVSQALKRCAKDLGDQFGLGLYNGGSTAPCLGRVIIYEGVRASGDDGLVAGPPEAVTTEPTTQGSSERSGGTAADLADRAGKITEPQRQKIYAMTVNRNPKLVAAEVLGRPIEHMADISITEAKKIIDHLVENEKAAAVSG